MEVHYDLLLRWNDTARLTSITYERAILDRHFLESFAALPYLEPVDGLLLDIGSGNGFPALPLLILRPELRGDLIEPAGRKRAFLKEVVREIGLEERVRVLSERILTPERLAGLGPFDCLTMRAVGRLEIILRGAEGGLAAGGRALLFLGKSKAEAVERMATAGLGVEEVVPLPRRRASYLVVLRRAWPGPQPTQHGSSL